MGYNNTMKFGATSAKKDEYYFLYLPSGFRMMIKYTGHEMHFRDYFAYKYWFIPFAGEPGEFGGKEMEEWSKSKIELIDEVTKIKIMLFEDHSRRK